MEHLWAYTGTIKTSTTTWTTWETQNADRTLIPIQ